MEAGSGLRRKDTTKGPPLRILSLDGGGVRGYSMLILLQELMYKTYNEAEGRPPRRDQIPKPCDYFDLIAGTGTGGLIAIMLGRLRLDIETCKEVYVRMTKRVFETDKTIAGIPYRSTLFKASKLEDAIKDCVREHTIFEDEGNDGTARGGRELPMSPSGSTLNDAEKRQSLASVNSEFSGFSPIASRNTMTPSRWGNPNASLYDSRGNRTKTAVTAVYKGTPKNGSSVLLRSYDSRKEPAPEFNCSIWQAGRATSAIGLAFKPIQIGQIMFIDEGSGNYNPAPQILDEAAVNEWPGREIGVFVSIGTGKRPASSNRNQHEWWEGFIGGGMGDWAEARRRLISKIESCEDTHLFMRNEHLAKRGVDPENYYRLNVEVGVGEFGMNEWSRLADVSTSTRMYLSKPETKRINEDAAAKMARIERAKRRHVLYTTAGELDGYERPRPLNVPPPLDPYAIELPGDDGPVRQPLSRPGTQHALTTARYTQFSSSQDKFMVIPSDQSLQMPNDHPKNSNSSIIPPSRRSEDVHGGPEPPPPLPPKTPIKYHDRHENTRFNTLPQDNDNTLPYPENDGPPPVVNMARKPEYIDRY
ncbi:hypothetical protein MMC26_005065 [Xylographa opegraphella]|nr:hypothetical protein [Xylographa opegraphella]